MKLEEKDSQISKLCRSFEQAVSHVKELANFAVSMEVLENFDELPESERSEVMRDTSAGYRRSTTTIYINKQTYFELEPTVQQAVLAHEVAHALAHQGSLMEPPCRYIQFGAFGEEFLADRLSCKWGFYEGLRQERLDSYKQPYVEVLEKWEDEDAYCRAMSMWHIKKLTGII